MDTSNIRHHTLDDIIFENRNKEYGAFDLRKTEKSTLLKALLIGSAICVAAVLGVYFYNTALANRGDDSETVVEVTLDDLNQPEVIEEVKPEEPPPPEEKEEVYQEETEQVKFIIPEPKKDPPVQETIPEKKDTENVELSTENREGKKSDSQTGGREHNPDAEKKLPTKPENKGPDNSAGDGTVYNANQVSEMAIFPGCEKFRGDKKQLTDCFGKELSNEILKYLDTEFPKVDKDKVQVQLEFVVNTEGYIEKINPLRGDDIFKPQAKQALEKAAANLKKRGKLVEPAKMANGNKVILKFNRMVVLQNPDY